MAQKGEDGIPLMGKILHDPDLYYTTITLTPRLLVYDQQWDVTHLISLGLRMQLTGKE